MTIQFWINDPTILFNQNEIFELWPNKDMCYEQKLNAITRLILLLTLLGYILTKSTKIIIVGVITIILIYLLYTMRKQKVTNQFLENFDITHKDGRTNDLGSKSSYINPVTLDAVLKSEFKEGNKKNPFSNVLLTQINDDPERKAAPPAFNEEVDEDITKNVKRTVQMLNPDIKNTNKQLFGDLWQNFQLDTSLRNFYSTPNTRVSNDQGAYGKYLYGFMPSGKESNAEGAFARVQDNYRYTLY